MDRGTRVIARGPVMIDLEGVELTAEERQRLRHPLIGGVILFSRNFGTLEGLRELVRSVRALRDPPLLVAVDHEGGRVQRFREGFTVIPPAAAYARLGEEDEAAGLRLAHASGLVMAAELRALDIDFSFAPVLDLGRGISAVIGDRAFGDHPLAVIEYAGAYVAGMREAGMAATGKHFPGHGSVSPDSHVDLPVDERPLAVIRDHDLAPFGALIGQLQGIMPAHVRYPAADPAPAGFSAYWLGTVLRGELGFGGVIFSDDLSMGGAVATGGTIVERAARAQAAGCDMMLVCNDPDAVGRLLAGFESHPAPALAERLAAMAPSATVAASALAVQEAQAEIARWRSAGCGNVLSLEAGGP